MCSVLKLDDNPDVNRLRQYHNYYMLTQSDTNLLISLCLLLKPDVLLNKCIFQDDNICGDCNNEFFDLETVRNNLLVAGSIMIGGQQKRVSKIMAFKMSWLQLYWIDPMKTLLERQKREELLRKQREERQRREREDAIRRQSEIRQRQERERAAAELRRRNEAQYTYRHVENSSTFVIL
ncbi:uncharacterized protein LOC132757063 [Ruditapes philippinarum]|uniref:uncharacterized protein LOC132757063 n=1 Tax=Ruditapes philippinarum TaxID=129788 RepID=UPI00295AF60E|nr:uncharacterized protein LOC132757063 [Ruditapes philippinarum]